MATTIRPKTKTVNFVVNQGATFQYKFNWTDSSGATRDLTGYTASLPIKESAGATPLYTADSASGDIVLGSTKYNIVITITATDTAAFDFGDDNEALYRLELTAGDGTLTHLLKGVMNLSEW